MTSPTPPRAEPIPPRSIIPPRTVLIAVRHRKELEQIPHALRPGPFHDLSAIIADFQVTVDEVSRKNSLRPGRIWDAMSLLLQDHMHLYGGTYLVLHNYPSVAKFAELNPLPPKNKPSKNKRPLIPDPLKALDRFWALQKLPLSILKASDAAIGIFGGHRVYWHAQYAMAPAVTRWAAREDTPSSVDLHPSSTLQATP
jgi:hypothetical protein